MKREGYRYNVELEGKEIVLVDYTERKEIDRISPADISNMSQLWKFINGHIGSSARCNIEESVKKAIFDR